MGLLDGLTGALGGAGAGAQQRPLLGSLLGMLSQGGGLQGLVRAFEQNGLGQIAGSWVGKGENQPVSPQQVQQAMGPQVQQLAQQHGMSTDQVSHGLSQLLPGVVDHLTPNGQVPTGESLGERLSGLRAQLGF